MIARRVLDAVERWADGMWLCRETTACVSGRIDGLLVPIGFGAACFKNRHNRAQDAFGYWGDWTTKLRVAGVEVKVSRSDFQRGLSEGQYDRYASTLGGLYLATPHKLCKTAELPANMGHLVIHGTHPEYRCACVRHPKWSDVRPTADDLWRILFAYAQEAAQSRHAIEDRYARIAHDFGTRAAEQIMSHAKRLWGQCEERNDAPLFQGASK